MIMNDPTDEVNETSLETFQDGQVNPPESPITSTPVQQDKDKKRDLTSDDSTSSQTPVKKKVTLSPYHRASPPRVNDSYGEALRSPPRASLLPISPIPPYDRLSRSMSREKVQNTGRKKSK